MRNFIAGILTTAGIAGLIGASVWIAVLPRLDWGADQKPPPIETVLAHNLIGRWVRRNARTGTNPFLPTSENLRAARPEYQEHCAACHALDGSGQNQFEADFYPPIARLTGAVQKLSDAEIYFIVVKGIRDTAMPAFGQHHSDDDIWRCVLWVRHLAHPTPEERAAIEREVRETTASHERTMEKRGARLEKLQ